MMYLIQPAAAGTVEGQAQRQAGIVQVDVLLSHVVRALRTRRVAS